MHRSLGKVTHTARTVLQGLRGEAGGPGGNKPGLPQQLLQGGLASLAFLSPFLP